MKKSLKDFIESLKWKSQEEMLAFIKAVEERMKKKNEEIKK